MDVKTLVLGELYTNTYIAYDMVSKKAVIVDPAGDTYRVMEFVNSCGIKIESILITHGHFEHIAGVNQLLKHIKVPVIAHEEEAKRMRDPMKNLSKMFSNKSVFAEASQCVKDDEVINLGGNLVFKCIKVPGHTEDSICFYNERKNIVFTGDTLMNSSIGRTDFYSGSNTDIVTNIKKRLLSLPGETLVFPGHGSSSTILIEREVNPYLKNNW